LRIEFFSRKPNFMCQSRRATAPQSSEHDPHRLNSQVESLRVALQKSARAHQESEERVSELTHEKSMLLLQVDSLEKRTAELTRQLSAQETLARSLGEATESNRQLSDKLRKRTAQVKDLKITVRQIADKCEHLIAQQLEQNRISIESVQKHARVEQDNRRLEDEVSELRRQLANQRESERHLRRETIKWKAEESETKQQLGDLQAAHLELRHTHSEIDQKLSSALRQVTELTDQNRRIQAQKNGNETEIVRLQTELSELQRKLRQISSEKAEVEARAEGLSDELRARDPAAADVLPVDAEIEELKHENADLITMIAQTQNELTKSRSRNSRLERELQCCSIERRVTHSRGPDTEDGEIVDDEDSF
jgi:chromosome segregation ATPase